MSRRRTLPGRRVLRWGAVGALAALVSGLVGTGVAGPVTPAVAADGAPQYTTTKTVTRVFREGDVDKVVDSRAVTVTVDKTKDLRGREVVRVDWSGARPSAVLSGDPASGNDIYQMEYPVLVLECRGTDDPAAPAEQRVRPETCWTSTPSWRRTMTDSASKDYRHDLFATDAERAAASPPAAEWTTTCGTDTPVGTDAWPRRYIPFVAVDGTTYWGCGNASSIPPEMSTDQSTALTNERIVATATDGTGWTQIEVRTAAENQSLGCSADVPCSLVVLPVLGLSCMDADPVCRREGVGKPGEVYDGQGGFSTAVTGRYWASASNWRNRITVPLSFAETGTRCDVLDPRPAVAFYGSEVVARAAEQWMPAYCGRDDRFKLQINAQPEGTAFRNLRVGYGAGVIAAYAEQTPPGTAPPDPPLGYAPVAATGFAVAFVVDAWDRTRNQATSMRLSPRLLAKLVTASYPAMNVSISAEIAEQRPDLVGNPWSLQADPEFRELNPRIDNGTSSWQGVSITLSSLGLVNVPSDVVRALTSYIAADPEAVAFLQGEPDPWGMTVNASYVGIDETLPRSDWPLQDTWVRPTNDGCEQQMPLAWFNRVLAPVSDLGTVALDLLRGTPEALTRMDGIVGYPDRPCQYKRVGRMPFGARAMLGIVSLGDAALYGLPTAALRTTGTGPDAMFVAPDDASLEAALDTATQAAPGAPFVVDAAALREHPSAYPGTMVLHVAAPLSGAEQTAEQTAQLVRVATTEGQVPGARIGQLADGFVPIRPDGGTAALFEAAQQVADSIEAQQGRILVDEPDTPDEPDDPGPQPSDEPSSPDEPDEPDTPDEPDGTATPDDPTDAPTDDPSDDPSPTPGGGTGDQPAAPGGGTVRPGSPAPSTPTVEEPTVRQGQPAPEQDDVPLAAARGVTQAATADGPLRMTLPVLLLVGLLAGLAVPVVRALGTPRPAGRPGTPRPGRRR